MPELNSPDSISEDLVKPLQLLTQKSPKRLTVETATATTASATSKRNPSPYYYSDLLKNKEEPSAIVISKTIDTAAVSSSVIPNLSGRYRKSNSLDNPAVVVVVPESIEQQQQEQPIPLTPKRYSITEEGVRIIRCDSPSTTTSDDSDCTECQKRRDWHSHALALVRDSCNILPSMPPHRLLGPAACICAGPDYNDERNDELFRPRSIFYVHQQGKDECDDCILKTDDNNDLCKIEKNNKRLIENRLSGGGGRGRVSRGGSSEWIDGEEDFDEDEDDEMMSGNSNNRTQRQFYETAFDCKISRSDDDLDDVDRINNHSLLLQLNSGITGSGGVKESSSRNKLTRLSRLESKRTKNNKNNQTIVVAAVTNNSGSSGVGGGSTTATVSNVPSTITNTNTNTTSATDIGPIATDLENLHLDNLNLNHMSSSSSSQLPMRGYTPSPPSTAPLPMKFPGGKCEQRYFMNSIKSAPNLPSTNPNHPNQVTTSAQHPRLRQLRLPIVSSHSDDGGGSSDGKRNIDRPRSVVLESSRVLELKRKHHHHHRHHNNSGGDGTTTTGNNRGHNFSSTESMATSSSGGSMESIRSSTSEGNRSTSSSESHHSTSLSSHSSDSGPSISYPLRPPSIVLHTKLHILSPISDKSLQEPCSEQSDNNRNNINNNNNNKIPTPDEIISLSSSTMTTTTAAITMTNNKTNSRNSKTRIPQNKTLLTIKGKNHGGDGCVGRKMIDLFAGDKEIQGSDSGISLHSRDDSKSRSAFHQFISSSSSATTTNTNNIILTSRGEQPSSSSSIVAVIGNNTITQLPQQELNDLPFDMPKLRRRNKILLQQVSNIPSFLCPPFYRFIPNSNDAIFIFFIRTLVHLAVQHQLI